MKRILFFLVLAFVVFGTNAQNAHLKFMGIPLDGKISAFNKELKKKGFMLDEFAGKKIDLYGWRLLSACHPIVYSMPCHPSFHFSVNHGCGNNGKCSTSFS